MLSILFSKASVNPMEPLIEPSTLKMLRETPLIGSNERVRTVRCLLSSRKDGTDAAAREPAAELYDSERDKRLANSSLN